MRDLKGGVAVITGGASGIGRALGFRLAREGMRVVLADVEAAALERTRGELADAGAEVLAVPTDVTRAEDVQALAGRTLEAFGDVHVVCNNAGVAPLAPLLETRLEDWRWVIDVNIMGVVHGISVFGPLLVERGRGHIVNTASTAGLAVVREFGAYAATKHAVVAISETLYHELDGTGVGVTAVCPMLVTTGIFRSERNRPEALGGPGETVARQESARRLLDAEGLPPERVADCVHDAIVNDELFALSHPETREVVRRRWEPLLAGTNPRVLPPFLPAD